MQIMYYIVILLKNGKEIWNFKTDKPLIKSQKKIL